MRKLTRIRYQRFRLTSIPREPSRPWIRSLGIRRLRFVQRQLMAHPKEYRQDQWHCGTAMCIAGLGAVLSGQVQWLGPHVERTHFGLEGFSAKKKPVDWLRAGTKAFRITAGFTPANDGNEKAHMTRQYSNTRLFASPKYWPSPFEQLYTACEPDDHAGRAHVAICRIDYFIRTGL